MEEIKVGFAGRPASPLHTCARHDYVLAFGSFFQRMGIEDFFRRLADW
jgi:hypothetical protein